MATTTYEPIATQTLSSAASTVTFSSISQSYTDLIIVFNGSNSTSTQYFLQLGNGSIDTGPNYSTTVLDGNGSSVASGSYINDTVGIRADYYGTGGGNIKQSIYQIQNYSNTTSYKTVLVRSSLPATETVATVGLWLSTSAINTIRFSCTSGNYDAGSTFTLYGIANAAIGAPKATGGVITYDNTYYYHTFGASGTFTPQQNLTNVDYLVIAGGGGGGYGSGTGGGGAGGLRSTVDVTGGGGTLESKISLNSGTAYTITVGAGGSGATSTASTGGNGGNSSIAGTGLTTITSTAGGGGGSEASGVKNGSNGGSGGGAAYLSGAVAGTGTANQGYAGGVGASSAPNYNGGGGGGAGAVGANAVSSNSNGGAGGTGVAIPSIANVTGTGVATYYAGGGGGSGQGNLNVQAYGGTGGAGGGGTGAGYYNNSQGIAAIAGTVNTGSGGGSGGAFTGGAGAAGGSGLVVIRYAKA